MFVLLDYYFFLLFIELNSSVRFILGADRINKNIIGLLGYCFLMSIEKKIIGLSV